VSEVLLFTDGASLGNPGPGGWAAILRWGEHEKELSAGFLCTTNNRMELMAVIEGLQALTRPCSVQVFTDSRYVHDAIHHGWLKAWQQNGWKTAAKKPVKNQDLWQRLIPLLQSHHVHFVWIRGHAGHRENERCDALAKKAASGTPLPPDPGMEEDCS